MEMWTRCYFDSVGSGEDLVADFWSTIMDFWVTYKAKGSLAGEQLPAS